MKRKNPFNLSLTRGGYRENAGRKPSWKHGETCTIRIPKTFASQLVELARRLDNGEKIDIDTQSKLANDDTVTKSSSVADVNGKRLSPQMTKELVIDIDTQSKLVDDDNVTKSESTKASRLIPQVYSLEKEPYWENDTKSNLVENDLVTQSNCQSANQNAYPPVPELREALLIAQTILRAKKSARESIVRLLSKLYSTTISVQDL